MMETDLERAEEQLAQCKFEYGSWKSAKEQEYRFFGTGFGIEKVGDYNEEYFQGEISRLVALVDKLKQEL